MLRYDKGDISQKHFTPEGFLKVDAIFTRTGVFEYVNNDGTIRKELRHPEDVFKDDSLKSMEMLPITMMHPKEKIVDSANSKKLSIGFTGEKINHDGNQIMGTVLITDKKAIEIIENDDIHELSLGYSVELVEDEGEFGGKRFDTRQTNIQYNHLAVVPRGRAKVSKLILDADDAVQNKQTINKDSNQKKEFTMEMVKTNLDGINYDTAPEVKNALDKAVSKLDTAEKSVTSLTEGNSTLQAKLDASEEKLKTAENVDNSEEIKTAVKARISLESSAHKHLDAEEAKEIETKTDSEIKVLVIKKYSKEFNSDDKDEAYINARFDVALENDPKKEVKADSKIKNQRLAVNGDRSGSDEVKTQADHRADMIKNMKNAYKPEAKA